MKSFTRMIRSLGLALLVSVLLTSCEPSKEKQSANSVTVVGNQDSSPSTIEPPIRETFTTAEELAKLDVSPLFRHNSATCKVVDSTLTTWTDTGASAYMWYHGVNISLRLNSPTTPTRIYRLSAKARIYLKNDTTGEIARQYAAPFEFKANTRPDSNFEATLIDVFHSNPYIERDKPSTSRKLDLGKFKLSINVTLDNGTQFTMPAFQIEVGRGNPFVDSRLDLYEKNKKK